MEQTEARFLGYSALGILVLLTASAAFSTKIVPSPNPPTEGQYSPALVDCANVDYILVFPSNIAMGYDDETGKLIPLDPNIIGKLEKSGEGCPTQDFKGSDGNTYTGHPYDPAELTNP